MSENPMTNSISEASREVARLSRELDITNADHIALWIEANTIPDEPMSQCASWLACRIVEAHEAAMSRASQPVDTVPLDSEAVERMRSIAQELVDQRDEPWPNGTVWDRMHFWRNKCLQASIDLLSLRRAALTAMKEDDRG